ncbi:MAG: hypothetical protein WC503_04420 [Candidatus Shapirobacteria bacterium]
MNINFGEGLPVPKIIDTVAKNFSQELKTGTKPETSSFMGGTSYKLFAEQAGMMQQESVNGVQTAIPEVDDLRDFSNRLVGSILDSRPNDTRMLVYAEKRLRESGSSPRDIAMAISETVSNLPPEKCAENMKGELKNHTSYLREQFFREFGGVVNVKPEVIAVDNPDQGLKKVAEGVSENEKTMDLMSGYIYTRDNGLEKGKEGIMDYMVDPETGTEAYCCSSFEGIDGYGSPDYGEDSVGFFKVGDKVVLIEADGVGQSFMGSYASHGAIDGIMEKGGLDLVGNTQIAGEKLKEIHDGLIIPDDIIPMLKNVLEKKKNISGSQTMLNQISIDSKTGEVDGCFMGDGGFTVLRKDGTRVDYDCAVNTNGKGDSKIRLSTLEGLLGLPASLEDVGAKGLILSSGDTILLYSDGITKNMLTKIDEINRSGGDFRKEIPKLIDSLRNSDEKDDDRSLLVFRMK